MALPPTTSVSIRRVLQVAQRRAQEAQRTQQVQIGEDLYCRIAPGGRKFLLFMLDGEPEQSAARAVAEALSLNEPQFQWYQGKTLRSLTVVEGGQEVPRPPAQLPEGS